VLMLALSLVLIIANLYLTQRTRPYISDDVSWQSTLMTWSPLNGHRAYVGVKDNFVVNIPLIWLLGQIFSPTRTLLFVEASMFAVCNFVLFYIAGLYFLKKCKVPIGCVSLLPFLWLVSFGYNFAALFLNTCWRNFEIGVTFMFFMLAAKLYYREFDPLKPRLGILWAALVCLVAGAFIFSDPYFLIFTMGPIAALFIILFLLRKVDRRQLLIVLGGVVLSLIIAKVIKRVLFHVGIAVPGGGLPLSIVNPSNLGSNIAAGFKDTLTIFGANFTGLHIATFAGVATLLNFAIVVLIVWRIVSVVRPDKADKGRWNLEPARLWRYFLGGLCAFVLAVYVLSSIISPGTYRYLIVPVYAAVLLLALYLPILKRVRSVIAVVLIAATFLNVLNLYHAVSRANAGPSPNSANYELIYKVQALGLTKGYGSYWSGNINTYLSGGAVKFLPTLCKNGRTQPYRVLVDSGVFAKHAARSFYILNPVVDSGPSPVCSEQQIIGQFGKPQQMVHVAGETVLVFSYDLFGQMQ
jgi:hypothetical protein